jgi:hypothetical protein
MAETKIKIVVDDSGVTKFIDSAGEEITKFADGLKETRLELKRIQDAIASGTFKDDELLKLQKRAGELKDKMGDLAEETRANAGNAFEGLNNNLSLTTDRLMNLDFEGASASLKGLSANAKNLTFAEVKKGLTDFVSGLGQLAKAILANPILLLASVITGVIVYWKELQALFNAGKIDKLEKQKQVLDGQAIALERQLNIQKKLDANNTNTYEQEKKILQTKIKSADKEIEIARLKGDTDKMTEAIKNKEQLVYDLKFRQAEEQAKLNKSIDDARRMIDKEYDAQRKREEATKGFAEAQAKLVKDEELRLRQQATSNKLFGNTFQTNKQITGEVYKQGEIQKGNGSMLFVQNTQEEKKSFLFQKQLTINEQALANKKTELGYLKEASKLASEQIKTDEQLAKEAEDKRKKEERDAENKRKREERLAKLEEEKKKLAEDVLAIEKEMDEFRRRGMTPLQAEMFQAEEKYKIQKATLEKAKVSQEELSQLEANYLITRAEINKKYADEKWLKDEAIRQKDIARVEEQFQLLQQLTSTAKENEIADAVKNAEKQYEQANGDAQTELAIKLDLEKKIADINKKYADEEIKLQKEKDDKLIEQDQKTAEKRQAIRDFAMNQISTGLSIISGMQDLALQNELQIAEQQNQNEEQKDAIRQKYFERQKNVQIAQALLSTFESAVNMFNSVSKSPVTIAFPAAPYIASASAIALGLVNVAKIRNTQFSGSASSSSSSSSTSSSPSFSSLSSPQASMNNVQPRAQQEQPVFQTYVVSGTITENQELSQLIRNQSKL